MKSGSPASKGIFHRMQTWAKLIRAFFHRNPKHSDNFKLKSTFTQCLWIFSLRIVALGILVAALVFGSKGTTFNLGSLTIAGAVSIDADTQLALLGLFNKLLDMCLQKSLEHSGLLLLTVRMTRPQRQTTDPVGVTLLDFELIDELVKPWTSAWSYKRRCSSFGHSWGSFLRFLITFIVSLCVLLQGVAVNTIGIPKLRWYPDFGGGYLNTHARREAATVRSPRTTLQSVGWMNFWQSGWSISGNGPPSWEAAAALSAARSLIALVDLPIAYDYTEKGWQPCTNDPAWLTGVNTVVSESGTSTISAQRSQVQILFDSFRTNGSSHARSSEGWTGTLNLTLPILLTLCQEDDASDLPDSSLFIDPPAQSASSFALRLGPIQSLAFPAARCDISFRQALFPLEMWIISMSGVDFSFDNYGKNYTLAPMYEPNVTPYDHDITWAIYVQLASIIPIINASLPSTGVSQHIALLAKNIRLNNPAFGSDVAATSPVVGLLAQNLLSMAEWSSIDSPDEMVMHYPIRWQVYGSGPRLAWEWVTVAVLAVVLCSYVGGIAQLIYYKVEPAKWFELGGMMVLAGNSERIDALSKEDDADKARYVVRHASPNRAELADGNTTGLGLLGQDDEYTMFRH